MWGSCKRAKHAYHQAYWMDICKWKKISGQFQITPLSQSRHIFIHGKSESCLKIAEFQYNWYAIYSGPIILQFVRQLCGAVKDKPVNYKTDKTIIQHCCVTFHHLAAVIFVNTSLFPVVKKPVIFVRRNWSCWLIYLHKKSNLFCVMHWLRDPHVYSCMY